MFVLILDLVEDFHTVEERRLHRIFCGLGNPIAFHKIAIRQCVSLHLCGVALDNLSTSVLRLCDTQKLSYEAASERCDLSSRYFGDIARGKTAPTILTLEKLCVGFDLTPNDLLISTAIWREMSFRTPMPVMQIRCFHFLQGLTAFPVCPQCGRTMEREYQSYCDRCGQRLDWSTFSKATIILPQK